jgi:hypothetical protein
MLGKVEIDGKVGVSVHTPAGVDINAGATATVVSPSTVISSGDIRLGGDAAAIPVVNLTGLLAYLTTLEGILNGMGAALTGITPASPVGAPAGTAATLGAGLLKSAQAGLASGVVKIVG